MTNALAPILFCLGVANFIVTIRLVRSPSYTPRQKILQAIIVWLLPVLGFAWIVYMLREDSVIPSKPNPYANRDDLQAFNLYSGDHTNHR
ncbi:MAG: hypothetical protein RSP_03000 [Rhodanobacter sp.]